jgi:hypothetical protein
LLICGTAGNITQLIPTVSQEVQFQLVYLNKEILAVHCTYWIPFSGTQAKKFENLCYWMDELYTVIHAYQMTYYKPLLLALLYWPALTLFDKSTGHNFPSMGISSTGNNYYTIKTLPVYVVSKSLPQDSGLYKFCPFFTPYSYYVPFHF